MRIGINLFNLIPQVGGLANYVMTLIRSWPEYHPQDELLLLTFKQNDALLSELPREVWKKQLRLENQNQIRSVAARMDVYFCPFGALWPRPFPKPSAITLVDVQERFLPEFFSTNDIQERLFHYDGSVKMADHIITISEFSRRSICEIFEISPDKITAIHLCDDILPQRDRKPKKLPDEWIRAFLFYPANDWRHKNHNRLLMAMKELSGQGYAIPLILTGIQENQYPAIMRLTHELGLSNTVVHLGRISRDELAWLYRHARALIFPSLFEGFGIPLVESMRCGLPIACSNTTSLPEAARDAAVYFDPLNVEDMIRAIKSIYFDSPLRNCLIEAGEKRSRDFGPEKLVREHRRALQTAITAFNPLFYWRRKLVDFPWSVAYPRRTIPNRHLEIARKLMHQHGEVRYESNTSSKGPSA